MDKRERTPAGAFAASNAAGISVIVIYGVNAAASVMVV
jgi:hypothetical protein